MRRLMRMCGWLVGMLALLLCSAALGAPRNVRDFGAVGDGTTDDTAAFAKAVEGGGEVYVPPGQYLIGELKLPPDCTLRGAGPSSRLIIARGKGPLHGADHCRISHLGLTSEEKREDEGPAPQDRALIQLRHCRDVVIEDITVANTKYTGVYTDHAQDVRIINSQFEKVNWAILLVFSRRIYVAGNRVIDAASHGIQFWGNWKFATQDSADLIFAGNYVKDGGGGPIWGAGAKRVIMTGNIVDGATDVGLDLEWCSDSVISGNTVRNCENAGISLFFACRRVSITGNTVINDREIKDPDASWYVRSGIWLTPPNRETFKDDFGHEDITIVGNTILSPGPDNAKRRGMWIGAEVKRVRIEGNTITGAGIVYGGHHKVNPQVLLPQDQPLLLDDTPLPDKPKF